MAFALPPLSIVAIRRGVLCQLLRGFIWLDFSGLEGAGVVWGVDKDFAVRGREWGQAFLAFSC